MEANRPAGRILTFYSYKGGTGRSMCLANVAWLLASSGKRVLVIDWDLEAPGLHRYFQPFLLDEELASSEGLMDMVERYASHAIQRADDASSTDSDWYLKFADISNYLVSLDFEHFPREGRIDLLPAGRQTDRYAVLVSSFNWQNFFDRLGGGGFLEAVKANARAEYDYILIDSRTGVSDTAGICSVQMPDSLVVCLTYNNQSIKGAAAVARSAIAMKRKLTDEALAARRSEKADPAGAVIEDSPREYRVFPVPMRVVLAESERLAMRQAFAQDAFSGMLGHLGGRVSEYWSLVEMPHISFYSYEEVLAPFKDIAHDPKSLLAAYVRLTRFLTDNDVTDYVLPLSPEEKKHYLNAFAETPLRTAPALAAWVDSESEEDALIRAANSAFQMLSDEHQTIARRVLLRLVRIGRTEEGGGYYRIRANLNDFTHEERSVIAQLAKWRLLTVATDVKVSTQSLAGTTQSNEQGVAIADDHLITNWKPLARWLEADHDFLFWRQQLRSYLFIWQQNNREEGVLLAGPLLREADYWTAVRQEELSDIELEYVEESRKLAKAMRMATEFTERAAQPEKLASGPLEEYMPAPAKRSTVNVPRKMLAYFLGTALAVSSVALWMSAAKRPAPPEILVKVSPEAPPAASGAPASTNSYQIDVRPAPTTLPPASASVASGPAPYTGTAAAATAGAPASELAQHTRLDIFWCVSSGDGALALAQQMKRSLKDELPFKEVRIAQLPAKRNSDAGYNAVGLQARPDAAFDDERTLADALLSTGAAGSVAAATGYRWWTVPSKQGTKDVLSVFICPAGHSGSGY